MKSIVEFRSVQKTYDGRAMIVRNLDLAVAQGEFLTLLGPSGSGKTTTLMMLAGFETPTRGEIIFDGRQVTTTPAHKRGIGVVFQSYALFPHMTVAENLAYPLRVRKLARQEIGDRVKRAIDMVKLNGFEHRMPAQLSGGQRQRVALARAIVFEPKLVLMDEPLGALDKQLREHMQYEIKQLHERLGVTIVYVTHDQGEALTMSDRVAIFNEGVIQQVAPPRELYERPNNAFVASFIGENNKLTGALVGASERDWTINVSGLGSVFAKKQSISFQSGQSLSLSVRPERLAFGEEAAACDNSFVCEILDSIYQGDHIRLKLRAPSNDVLFAKVLNKRATQHFDIGSTIMTGFQAEDCSAFTHRQAS
ncbi:MULTISPECIES: ABC transporter ATP-binding protein [unclassified Caballeronia]|uniref:ABC transporter ATP-binding protein n=1 Tax=unclassified Caballeronia TaxID=2646786 RepID=UPI00202936F3|nr:MULTISPECIES: ABC transporter ATP-binding protein [unclassified Caballeronia]